MSNINFDNPYLLLLAVPLVILFAVPFFMAIRRDNANGHNIASAIIHVVIALFIAFAAAGTSIVTTVTETDVYVLADVSYSTSRNYDLIDEYIDRLDDNLPANSRLGVIAFGKNSQLLSRLGEKPASVSTADEVDTSGTDIEGALDFAGKLFRQGVLKHIVVITDGKQSDESDSNALKRKVDALADDKVHVSAIYINDNLPADVKEIQLSSVDIQNNAYLNRDQTVTVTIKCNGPNSVAPDGTVTPYSAQAILTLTREGAEVARRTVYLSNGDNYESFTLSTAEAGAFNCTFKLSWDPSCDTNDKNNVLNFTQNVSSDISVLLISSNRSDSTLLRQVLGEDANITEYINVPNVPCTVEELCKYDEIVLSDTDVLGLTNNTMFLSSLDTAVSLFGKTLITLGNTHIQSYSSGELSALSDMLPVVYGNPDDAPKLYTVVIDTSRSMNYDLRMSRAKEAAKEIVNLLNDSDYFNLIEFNGNSYIRHNSAYMLYNRQEVLDTIDSLTEKQGTSIGSGLRAAFDIMKNSTAYSEKRVMLITDGYNFTSDSEDPALLAAEMADYNIVTSVLDVEYTENSDAYKLLSSIARNGGGKHIDISSDSDLEEAMQTELPSDVNQETGGLSDVYVSRVVDDVLEGLDGYISESSTFANTFVTDYYVGAAKASATSVLQLRNYIGNDRYMDFPLYAYWQYGNGKAVSFTSSTAETGGGLGYWDEDLKKTLFTNLFDVNIPDEKIDYPFVLDVNELGGYTHITLTPATVDMDATASVTVTLPDGSELVGSMAFGSKTYDYEFVTSQVGDYAIEVQYNYGPGDDKTFTVNRYVSASYEPEYDSFTLFDAAALHKMVGTNGTVSEDGNLEITNAEGEAGVYNLPLALPLLIAAVVLFAIDIGVRKLKWDDIKGLFKKVNG